jgi:methyl-accepting chemotaxis protein
MRSFTRRPIGNFFIKRELQLRLISKIVLTVLITTIICVGLLLFVFYMRYKTVLLYQMSIDGELTRERIVDVLLPGLMVSAAVNVLVGIAVGLYASRKYAVPIYKLEQWAKLLMNGHLTAKLIFREKEEMKELSSHCNTLADSIRNRFVKVHENVVRLKELHGESEEISEIENALKGLELQTGVDVTTGFYEVSSSGESTQSSPP